MPLTERISAELADFLDRQLAYLHSMSPDLAALGGAARVAVMDGGKRLRPTFAYWGWRSVRPAGADGEPALLRAAASLELLQACALVHDDLIDDSGTRRGQSAAHVRFAELAAAEGWPSAPDSFGRAGAVLLGDLLLSWSEQLFAEASGPLAPGAREQFDLMHTEVVAGQYLDVLAQHRGGFEPAEALRVIRFKTSKYTVVRPLQLGAGAAGAGPALLAELADYGYALGEAFQLRDDLLGVFGDPSQTGKPAGDDLREGKRTLLVALAMRAAGPAERQLLRAGVGDRELSETSVNELRELLVRTGARDAVERRIADRAAAAVAGLSGAVRPDARDALHRLADAAAHRSF